MIITSLLDMDLYKITMCQFVFHRYPNINVEYEFTNRSKIKINKTIDENEFKSEIKNITSLSFTDDEINYLRGTGLFKEDFLAFLKAVHKEHIDFNVDFKSNDFEMKIKFNGLWRKAILYETLILSTINELYTKSILNHFDDYAKDEINEIGKDKLLKKIDLLKEDSNIKIIDFGTRRRSSKDWHKFVIETLRDLCPKNLLGTSNVLLAKELNLKPIGTFSHEFLMVVAGLKDKEGKLELVQDIVLHQWYEEYSEQLSIALTDTFSSDIFFRDFNIDLSKKYKGVRQDSGDPIEFTDKAIKHYRSHGIDPKNKLIVFSDGLDIDTILKLYKYCKGKIQCSFGWGTNLTNDIGLQPLSIVIKASKANGIDLVKLSDNPAKHHGRQEDIERYKKIFNYKEYKYVKTKY